MDIPDIFLIFPSYVKYVFPCVFLNLWSQEKTSPYRKTMFIFSHRFYTFYISIIEKQAGKPDCFSAQTLFSDFPRGAPTQLTLFRPLVLSTSSTNLVDLDL